MPAKFQAVSVDKVALDMIREFSYDFCRSKCVPPYDIFNVTTLPGVANGFVYNTLVFVICILLMCRFSRFRLMCSYVIYFLRFVRCFVPYTFYLGVGACVLWPMKSAFGIPYSCIGTMIALTFKMQYSLTTHFQSLAYVLLA